MATETSPAYQWYVKDWRSSRATMRMSFAERGVYRDMLDQQWEDRTLPDDPQAVAELIASSDAQIADVLAAWAVVRRKFVTLDDGRIQNARLERCRREQRKFKKTMTETAQKGGQARAASAQRGTNGTFAVSSGPPAAVQPPSSGPPAVSSPASALASASASSSASASAITEEPRRRKERPQFENHRFAVHRWQVDVLISMLGKSVETFELDEWLMTGALARAEQETAIVPDWWEWLKAETVTEARRRNLPIAAPASAALGKQTTRLAAAVANIHREAR